MSEHRISSNNPFQEALSADSTGNSNTPPIYPSSNNNTSKYYSSDEKERLRKRDNRENTTGTGDLPPSYEEAAGPKPPREYPREKQQSSSTTSRHASREHRTRVDREWQGDSSNTHPNENGVPRSEHRSSHRRPSDHRSGATPSSSHRSDADRERRHRSSRDHRSSREHHSSRDHRSGEHRSSRHKSSSSKSKSKKDEVPPKNVDTIDKLDVTGLFGGAFHHDGPFDACTPHRNKDTKAAPVLAFPADGPNNSIRGSGPINHKEATLNYIQGRDDEDDLYTTSVRGPQYQRSNESQSTLAAVKVDGNVTQFDSKAVAEPVHGHTTLGLGSSTFLDGAPASYEDQQRANVGLGRKKSLRQRITGDNGNTPSNIRITKERTNPSLYSPDEDEPLRFTGTEKESTGNSLLRRVKSLKVGRTKS